MTVISPEFSFVYRRTIVHSDINHCYAQIEEMLNPELKKQPMAVGGSQEERHGIILAKNLHAKKYKIQTGEILDEAWLDLTDLQRLFGPVQESRKRSSSVSILNWD